MSYKIVLCVLAVCLSGCGNRSEVTAVPVAESESPKSQVVAEVSGECYDTSFEARLFRACQLVPDDADAVNLFMWSINAMYEARNNLDERTAQPKDMNRMKMATSHHAIFQIDRGTMVVRFKHGGASSPDESR